MDLDDIVCPCFHVSMRKVVRYVERERPKRASRISECLSAGTGCGWCVPMLRRIHREVLSPSEVRESEHISAAEYEAARQAYRRLGAGEVDLPGT